MALLWDVVKSPYLKNQEKHSLILSFDKVFGLNLAKIKEVKVPKEIKDLASKREKYRTNKKWKEADEIRKKVEKLGYQIEDTKEGPKINPVRSPR